MYSVMRRYSEASALSDALMKNEQEIRELMSSVPGFVAYYAMRSGDSVATITVCQDASGTTESTRRAAEWVKQQNLSIGSGGAPQVTEGDVFLQFD